MKLIILFLLLLFIFLIISLGINYSSVFKTTLKTVQTYVPTPISSDKYTSPTNYYSDVSASQGVFSKTVPLTSYTVEPMANRIKKPIKDRIDTWGYKGPQGAAFNPTPQTVSSSAPTQSWTVKNGVDYGGNDLGNFQKSVDDCKIQCLSTSGCVGFVTGKEGENQCSLKSGFQTETANSEKNTYMLSSVTEETTSPDTSWKSSVNVEKYKDKINSVLSGSNLPEPNVNSCSGTQYGCCPDNVTAKSADGSNCAPYPPPTVGGCAGTQYGCCPDNVTAKSADGSNCPSTTIPSGWIYNGPNVTIGKYNGQNITAYAGTGPNYSGYVIKGPNGNVYSNATPTCNLSQYGCCPDNITAKNADGSNCLPVVAGGCALTPYGCCPDNVTAKNADGSNCSTTSSWFNSILNSGKFSGPNVTAYAAKGPNNSGLIIEGPNGNVYTLSTAKPVGGCAGTQYGCCPDGITSKTADGTNCAPYPPPPIGGCAGTQYGCCPDNVTAKNADGSNCSPYPPPSPTTNTVFIPPPSMPLVENSPSSSAEYASADGTDSMSNTTNNSSNNSSTNTSTDSTCPSCPAPQPCPPCGRCPEPSFDCKKVPNYSSTNSEYLPMPVLSDFSQFGM